MVSRVKNFNLNILKEVISYIYIYIYIYLFIYSIY